MDCSKLNVLRVVRRQSMKNVSRVSCHESIYSLISTKICSIFDVRGTISLTFNSKLFVRLII